MIWPFKQKMTIDYLANMVARAAEENMDVYRKAISNHAAENVSEEQMALLKNEFWALDLAILLQASAITQCPPEISSKLYAMLVVGHASLDSEGRSSSNSDMHLKRAEQYASAVANASEKEIVENLVKTFVEVSGIQFRTERVNVNREVLKLALGFAVIGSLEGLGELISYAHKNFKIY